MNRIMGIVTLVIGLIALSAAYFFIHATPLLAVGIAAVILGLTRFSFGSASTDKSIKAQRRLMVTFVLVFGGIIALLAFLGQQDIAVYYIAFSLAFIVITLANNDLSSESRFGMSFLSSILFIGFLYTLTAKLIQIV